MGVGALVALVEVAVVCLAVYGLIRAIGWVVAHFRAAFLLWLNDEARDAERYPHRRSGILGLLMLLAAGSRLTDFDYLAERYQSLISGGPNAVRRTLQTLGR